MAKTKISEFSSTPANNTDIDSINIAEGCAPSGINDAIRELMSQLKDFQVGSAGDPVTVGGVLTVQAGSASAPALTTSGDTNTGIFFPAADTIAFAEGGAEAMRIDSSGNLGLGVTPSAWDSIFKAIDVGQASNGISGNSGTTQITQGNYYNSGYKYGITGDAVGRYEINLGKHIWNIAPSGTAGNAITFTQAMTLDASGRLGIGLTSPIDTLQVNGGITVGGDTNANDRSRFYESSGLVIDAGVTNARPILFRTQGAERARIDSSGNLLVGKTGSSASSGTGVMIQPNGFVSVVAPSTTADTYDYYNSTAGSYRFYVTNAGVINATSTTITAISDQRLKENIRDLDDGLEKLMTLKPRKFDWKEGKGSDTKDVRGFIAQEFETVFPDMIDTWKDPAPEGEEPYKSVRADLIPVLVKAIQEQQALITQLQADVAALKA